MATEIAPGTTYHIYGSGVGRTDPLTINGEYSNYDTRKNQAECHCYPGLLDGDAYTWAECGRSVAPQADGTLLVTVDGNWSGLIRGINAPARVRFEIIIYNATNGVQESNTVIYDKTTSFSNISDTGSYSKSVSTSVESGKTYLIGVRSDTWAVGAITFASWSDAAPPGNHNGYHNYDYMKVELL